MTPENESGVLSRRTLVKLGVAGALAAAIDIDPALAVTPASWPPREFPIAMWCSPPEPFITTAQYRTMEAAGFNVVLPPCEGGGSVAVNKKILDTARETGLTAIVGDSRMPLTLNGKEEAERALKAIVNDYGRHPALLGYFLTDEPGAGQFGGLAEVVASLRKLDPNRLAYINLFPNYATNNRTAAQSQLGTDTYDAYLSTYLDTVRPSVLSWDHYHFLNNGSDRPGFLGNLGAAQRAAAATSPRTPFWQIVLSVQHGPYRPLKEAELRYEAMQTLAYGASGLVYFTYWPPQDEATYKWSHGIMNRDGTPGPLYEPVKSVNQDVRKLAHWLYGAGSVATFQTGELPPDGRPPRDDVPITVKGEGNLTIGLFRDSKDYVITMVTNRDYEKPAKATLLANAGSRNIERLDLSRNRWAPVNEKPNEDGVTTLAIDLAPAAAGLIRWQ